MRNSYVIALAILVIGTPAATSLITFMITKDPTYQPLGRTHNDEADFNGTAVIDTITAHVQWPRDRRRSFTKIELVHTLKAAFRRHGADVRIIITEASHSGPTTIAYQVGANHFPAARIGNATDSIQGALAAIQMYKRAAGS